MWSIKNRGVLKTSLQKTGGAMKFYRIYPLIFLFTMLVLIMSSCGLIDNENEELLKDKAPGRYSYTSEITGTIDMVDSGTLDISVHEDDPDNLKLSFTLVELSATTTAERQYIIDIGFVPLAPVHPFLIQSQRNPRSQNELISGTGGYEFVIDGESALVDGWFDTEKDEVTLRYTASKQDTILLVTLSAVKNK